MIYLFTGGDIKNKLSSYDKFISEIPKSTEIFAISKNDFGRMQVESLYSGANLFSPTTAIIFSNILESGEEKDFLLDKIELLAASQNTFIFLEGKLGKPMIEIFKKAGAEVWNFEEQKGKKEKFNNFLIANAFSEKKKLNTWIYFRQAIENGTALEEIVGIIFWKIKDMIIKKRF